MTHDTPSPRFGVLSKMSNLKKWVVTASGDTLRRRWLVKVGDGNVGGRNCVGHQARRDAGVARARIWMWRKASSLRCADFNLKFVRQIAADNIHWQLKHFWTQMKANHPIISHGSRYTMQTEACFFAQLELQAGSYLQHASESYTLNTPTNQNIYSAADEQHTSSKTTR